MKINQNFNKFVSEFSVLEQVQDFKPMKKPYNSKSPLFVEFIEFINKNKNPKYGNNFTRKRKMLVRDWLFYFYWCQKCKLSLIGKKINPLRLEFSRFFSLVFNFQNEFFNNNNNSNIDNNIPYLNNTNNINNINNDFQNLQKYIFDTNSNINIEPNNNENEMNNSFEF
jgi:hypothetical protein